MRERPFRRCSGCQQDLPRSEFYADARTQDGLKRRCRTCHSAKSYASRKKVGEPASRQDYHRRRQLAQYGLTPETYDQLLADQGGVCAICRQPERVEGRRLAVDHCHVNEENRGLLCSDCNTGLGKFGDDPALLRAALAYLLANCCEGAPL